MIIGLFRHVWLQMLIAFDPNYTIEGFEKTGKSISLPPRISEYEPTLKRHLTICNLYANQGHSIGTISKVLDVSRRKVVSILIEEGLIKERRRTAPKPRRGDRRQRPFVVESPTGPAKADAKVSSAMNPGLNPLGIAATASPDARDETSSSSRTEENASRLEETQSLSPISLFRKAASSRG